MPNTYHPAKLIEMYRNATGKSWSHGTAPVKALWRATAKDRRRGRNMPRAVLDVRASATLASMLRYDQ